MRYLHVNTNSYVDSEVYEFDKKFPNIPLSERYSKEFLDSVVTTERTDVAIGWRYEDGEWITPPPQPDPPQPEPESSFIEEQEEFNLDIDYRVTCLELGI